MFPGQCGNTAFFFKSQPDQFHFEFRGIVFPGKSFFSAHEVSTCKISGCLSYRILDSGPDGTQTTLTNKWLTEEESLWLQSRVYVRAHHYYHSWMHYFSAYSLGRLYWQSSQCEDNASLREALTLYKYDSAGSRMFEELAAGSDRFYATLPWQPLTVQSECPVTLKDVSDL
ncbi:FIG00637867: hypothetical protein [Escherichia coli]|nr:FIG00637867: hypothetical protein [Escherichia coli]